VLTDNDKIQQNSGTGILVFETNLRTELLRDFGDSYFYSSCHSDHILQTWPNNFGTLYLYIGKI